MLSHYWEIAIPIWSKKRIINIQKRAIKGIVRKGAHLDSDNFFGTFPIYWCILTGIHWPMSPQGLVSSSLCATARFWHGVIPKKWGYNMKNPLENDENWLQQMRKPIFNLFIWKVDESYWLYGTMFCLSHLWGVFHIFCLISKHVFDLEI